MTEVRETAETPEFLQRTINITFTDNLVRNLRHSPTTHRNLSRLRLSSHNMSIETRLRSRVRRENRLCQTFKVLGDKSHYIYDCCEIDRTHLEDIRSLDKLSSYNHGTML